MTLAIRRIPRRLPRVGHHLAPYAGPHSWLTSFAVHLLVWGIVALVALHLLGGLFHHRRHRRRGHRVNIGWSLRRGWWGGVRVGGGTYYHDL